MKKLLTFFLALIAGAGTLFADDFYEWDFNDSGKCGPNLKWEYTIWDDRLVISGTGDMYNWDKKSDVPWYKHYVKVVEIGENVTSIGTHAFDSSTKLYLVHWNAKNCPSAPFDSKIHKIHTVKFGDKVEVIPDNLFYGMDVSKVNIPDNVKTIGNNAFRYSGVFNLTIGDGVTHIGKGAFSNCSELNSVSIGAGVTYIGDGAFDGCTKIQGIGWHAKNCPVAPFADANGVININFYSTVEVIPANLCAGKSKLTQIVIPNSVKTIGSNAFKDCIRVSTLEIGTGVTSIGAHAFENCPITYLHLPDGLQTIGSYAFAGCRNVAGSMSIPSSVTSVGEGAFYQCSGLNSVSIGSGVTSIAAKTFQGCSSFASITIPSEVTSIGASAFQACTSLAKAYLPDNLTSIGDSAFNQCSSLADITIPDKVTSLGKGVFNGCHFTSTIQNAHFFIYLPRMVTGNYAIKEGIETIADRAFQGCSGLTSVTIPSSVKAIRTAAFSGCNHLNSITCEATTPPACAFEEIWPNSVWAAVICPVYVPIGCVATYKNITSGSAAEAWRYFEDFRAIPSASGDVPNSYLKWSLKDGVLTISGNGNMPDFYYAYQLPWNEAREYISAVVLNDGVGNVGMNAFLDCTNLTTVVIKSTNFNAIGENAFKGCTALKAVDVLAANTTYASQQGVLYNKDLTQLVLCPPANKSYTFPASVTSVLPTAFDGCTAPFTVTNDQATPPTVSGNTLFAHVTGTVDAYVPEANIAAYKSNWGTTNCEYHALNYGQCTVDGIKYEFYTDGTAKVIANSPIYSGNIVIPETFTYNSKTYTVTELDKFAFLQCTGLTSVSLPNTLEKINMTFYECTALTSITIPESVTTLNPDAFAYCSGLQEIYCKSYRSVPSMGSTKFYHISTDLPIYVPTPLLNDYRTQWSGMTNIQPEPIIRDGLYFTIDPAKQNATVVQHPDGAGGYDPLVNVTIPETIEAYGQTFSVDTIGKNAFYGCEELLSITMPKSIVSIEEYAFYNCRGVKQFIIPENVTSIGQRAFWDCKEMTSLAIYGNVATIGDYAFRNCSKIASITCEAATPPTCIYQCLNSVTKTIPLYVPSESVNAYKEAKEWKEFTNIRPLIDKCKDVNNTEKAGEPVFLDSVYVIFVSGRYAYVQDQSGTTLVYLTNEDPNIKPGVRISNICGSVSLYSNLPEVKPNNQAEWILTPGGGETPIFVTVDDMPTADMVNQLVYIPKGAIEGTFNSSSETNLNLTLQNGKTMVLRNRFKQDQVFSANKVYDLLVAVGQYWTGVQLYYIQIADTYDLYNIRFLNENGTELQSLKVPEGTTAVYTGETPAKAETDHSTFRFVGWDKTIAPAAANADYTAVFEESYKRFIITLAVNDDAAGAVYGGGTYDYGASVTLFALPNMGYHFVRWTDGSTDYPRVVTVTGDATYTAEFESDTPTGLEEINDQMRKCENEKIIIDGQLYILRGDKIYTVTGQVVK
jgi:hypothetical protein